MKVSKFFYLVDANANGYCIGDVVKKEFDSWDGYSEKYNLLIGKSINGYEDLLYQMNIDYDFLKQVNRLDVISPDCFYSDKNDVKQFIDFIDSIDMHFIIHHKIFSREDLFVRFEACNHSYIDESIKHISKS